MTSQPPAIREARIVRHRLGLSLRDAAQLVGLHWVNLGLFERGKLNLRPETMQRIADAYGVGLDDITRDGSVLNQDR